MIAIFIQSSLGQIKLPNLGFVWQDKLLHFIVFGILAFLIARSFSMTKYPLLNRLYYFWGITISTFYGMSDEVHQYFVPGRSSNVSDLIADLLGSVTFIIVFYFWEKHFGYLKQNIQVKIN